MQFSIIKISLQPQNFSKDGGTEETPKESHINQINLVEMLLKELVFVLVEKTFDFGTFCIFKLLICSIF